MALSRVGRAPVVLPAGVKGEVAGNEVRVQGPKGKLSIQVPPGIVVAFANNTFTVTPATDTRLKERDLSSRHGLTRALIRNMVGGVVTVYERKIELMGAGFRPTITGNKLSMTLGFSHPVVVNLPEGVTAKAEKVEAGARGEEKHTITLSGCDKAVVGELAANIRKIKKADVYKGKGIRYAGEQVRKKAGKAAATAGGTGGK